ncbi:PREDICTED: cAMP-regulated phosphoprotein 19-like [Priapulus caudatus]|uniref:cAMP-regulated phosphoprotein 19-like n=1 Tax=Priapulus caudatus TaxID=37621 RepID=A0ABM1F1B0_PRICU|nr:PREDICTED: cAMP-regulated phosphoprotein 19-like [Priapulus caudatus]
METVREEKEQRGDSSPAVTPVDEGNSMMELKTNPEKKTSPEQLEEKKLRAKYPQGIKAGGSNLLQKRLQKGGPKYFDSGDYNMAKAGKTTTGRTTLLSTQKLILGPQSTGDEHPTPDSVPSRKSSVHTKSHLVS